MIFKSTRREETFGKKFVRIVILIALKDLDKIDVHERAHCYNSEKLQ